MATHHQQTLTAMTHLNDSLFSFKVTHNSGFRFRNGYFVMIGLTPDGKALMRAYSMASPNHAEALDFSQSRFPTAA